MKMGCFVIPPLFPLSCPVNNTGIPVLSYISVSLPGASRECRGMLKWKEGLNFCLPFFFQSVFDLFHEVVFVFRLEIRLCQFT